MLKYLVLIVFVLFVTSIYSQVQNEYSIAYLSTADGLSQNEVTSIIKDKYGFMWFGTVGGLNRFDGYNFKHFKPGYEKNGNLTNPSIERLYADSKDQLYVGTKSGGCNIYDLTTDLFSEHTYPDNFPKRIISFFEDKEKNLWYGSWDNGLWKYDHQKDTFINVIERLKVSTIVQTPDDRVWCGTATGIFVFAKDGTKKRVDLPKHDITEMILDSKEPYLWIVGWSTGLIRYNYLGNNYKQFDYEVDGRSMIRNSYSVCEDQKGNIYVGTWGGGLLYFNKTNEQIHTVDLKPKGVPDTNINYDVILDIFKEENGDVWVGTDGGGVIRLYPNSNFNTLSIKTNSGENCFHINTLIKDVKNKFWLGTKGSGLYSSDSSGIFIRVPFEYGDISNNEKVIIVKKIIEDSNGIIWVSIDNDLYVVNSRDKKNIVLEKAYKYFKSPDLKQVKKAHDILLNSNDIWIGTQQNGLYHFKIEGGIIKIVKRYHALSNENFIPENRVTSVFNDSKDDLWISTYNGLLKFNKADSSFIPLNNLLTDSIKPLCQIALSTFADNEGIWYGTPCSLNRLKYQGDGSLKLSEFTKNDGLSDDYVNAILCDKTGNIWISTNGGLSCLNKHSGEILNYDISDGVGAVNFTEAACYKDEDNILYFGSYQGVTYFNPNKITKNKSTPNIVFTDFKILNKPVEVSDKGTLTKSINEVDRIEFSYRQNEFSFEFSSLDFKAPHKNQYSYLLEGNNDNEWVKIRNRRRISFNNLKPGEYNLQIKGSNSNGVWNNNIKSIILVVHPPVWKTWYAIVLYALLIILIVLLIVRIQLRQDRLSNQIDIEKLKREKEHQLTEYKLKFFTNVSHELRTPLTLISAPISEVLAKDPTELTVDFILKRIGLVQHNTNKLHNLINQLLEFRKVDAGKLKLKVGKQDIVPLVTDIGFKFNDLATEKDIEFETIINPESQYVCFDNERMEVVLNNLLSNAFKFAGKPGIVKLGLSVKDGNIEISVSNNGTIIPKQELEHLFDRFYQVKGMHSISSSGIGLALVKTYVDLHHGSIEVKSRENELTTFTVKLKLGTSHFKNNELVLEHIDKKTTSEKILLNPQREVKTQSINNKGKGSKIVVVEDNKEVRGYLKELLQENYDVKVAEDGFLGYDLIVNQHPALIISDVMMPGMDGFELCRKVKSNDQLAHIPVLLLTAKGTPEDELFGTKKGADAYIVKPFNPELLKEKIKMLISTRKTLSDKFTQRVRVEGSEIEISNKEASFIKNAINKVEQFIESSDFDAETLANEMAMSNSTFYRKLKKATGQSPREFILAIKMKRAAQYLKESDYSVSEIVEKLGYQEIKTFRRNFKEHYKVSPSGYRSGKSFTPEE